MVISIGMAKMQQNLDDLASILAEAALVNNKQMEEAKAYVKRNGGHLDEAIVGLGFAKEPEIMQAILEKSSVPFMDPGAYQISKEAAELVQPEVMVKNRFIVLDKIADSLLLAICAPIDPAVVESLSKQTECKIVFFIAPRSRIMQMLRSHSDTESVMEAAERLEAEADEEVGKGTTRATAVRVVDSVQDAMKKLEAEAMGQSEPPAAAS